MGKGIQRRTNCEVDIVAKSYKECMKEARQKTLEETSINEIGEYINKTIDHIFIKSPEDIMKIIESDVFFIKKFAYELMNR